MTLVKIESSDAYLQLFAYLTDHLLALLLFLAQTLLLSGKELLVATLSVLQTFRRAIIAKAGSANRIGHLLVDSERGLGLVVVEDAHEL